MLNNEFLKKRKNQLMISDKRFQPREVQSIIEEAIIKGVIVEKNSEEDFTKYQLNYRGFDIVGENYKNQKYGLFCSENKAFTRFRNLDFFTKRAIESKKPIIAFVNYKTNKLSDGWLFYHNKEVSSCKQVNFIEIIDLINDIHSKGMILKKPSIDNFKFDGVRVIVDGEVEKNYIGIIGKYLNFVHMKNSLFIFEKIYPFKNNFLYRVISKIAEIFHYSKDIPELSVNYFKESKEELHKIKRKIKKGKNVQVDKIKNIEFEEKKD